MSLRFDGTERHGRSLRLAIAALAVLMGCALSGEIGQAAEDAVKAVLRVFTHIGVINAALGQCVVADVDTARNYTDIFAQYTKETLPILNRMTQISQAEEQRSPRRKPTISQEISTITNDATNGAINMRLSDTPKFVAHCRDLPAMASGHQRGFAPLTQQFPAEMRLIDEWR